ncbi:MAG: AMP-binding protein, partial [Firmicutes bacterium]|nr:AMP-binding protein [Bacillota bacterium]
MSPSLLRDFVERTGITVLPGMGYSEAAPIIASVPYTMVPRTDRWEDVKEFYQKDGIELPLLKFRMVNEKGEEVRHDGRELGKLGAKGPHIMGGYIDNPEANAKAFDSQGYFYSGDVGTIDEQGYITTRDRIEDMIREESGYISPSMLEGIVGELPYVKEVGAVGVPYGQFERAVVCVNLKDEYAGKVSAEDIRNEFEGKVPGPLPEVIIVDTMMPRGPTGKYDKRKLREFITAEFLKTRQQ